MGSSRPWGAEDTPLCPKCGQRMFVTRRAPHPQHENYERQTLLCICGEEVQRSADAKGDPHASDPSLSN